MRETPDFLHDFFDQGKRVRRSIDPTTKNTVRHDRWDREDLRAVLSEIEAMRVAQDDLEQITETAPGAIEDTFFGLMKAEPGLKEAANVRPSYMVNRTVMGAAMDLTEFEQLRLTTTGDLVAAGLAVSDMEPELEKLFDQLQDAQNQASAIQQMFDQMGEFEQEFDDVDQMIADMIAGGTAEGDEQLEDHQAQQDRIREAMDQLENDINEAKSQLEGSLRDAAPQIQEHMKNALDEAQESADAMDNMSAAWGLEAGAVQRLPAKKRIELAQRMKAQDKFKRLARLIGPMQRLALSEQARRTTYAREEVYDVELGDDLLHLLGQEYALLDDDIAELDFIRRYNEKLLQQYKLRGVEKVARGDIFFCADTQTEILTDEGWRFYDELSGDEHVYTLNHETGEGEWNRLERVNIYESKARDMVSIEGQRISSLTTQDHRWPVVSSRDHGERFWRTSETLTTEMSIPACAPCINTPVEKTYSDALVEVVAWTWTEGTIASNCVYIYQSHKVNPGYCDDIRDSLTRLYGEVSTVDMRTLRHENRPLWVEDRLDNGMTQFRLNALASEPVLAVMYEDKSVYPAFVVDLTREQLELFVDMCVNADGQRKNNVHILGQRVQERTEAFEIASILLGRPVRTVESPDMREDRTGSQYICTARLAGGEYIGLGTPNKENSLKKTVVRHEGIVWCPTTPNGTWLARRNGTVYFTGNCGDGSGSMGGDREIWAKAVGLALQQIAYKQQRSFTGVHFGSPNEYVTFEFDKATGGAWVEGEGGSYGNKQEYPREWYERIEAVMFFAELFFNSGTDFVTPLTVCLEKLQAQYAEFGAVKGDIVFVTDGQCGVDDSWMKEFKAEQARLGFRVWGIIIDGMPQSEPLNEICDGHVWSIGDLLNGSDVADIFREI